MWTLVDVIGNRHDRKKWSDHFGGVSAIFYVVNLSGYNKQLTEEPTVNRMQVTSSLSAPSNDAIIMHHDVPLTIMLLLWSNQQEELSLFASTMSNPIFATTPTFLFLNKRDIFDTQLTHRGLEECFPEFKVTTISYYDCTIGCATIIVS
jgi:hypothetical protein